MADIRIKDLTTTASSTASDDFIAVDGTTNGTRKLSAFSPTFGGNATVTGTLTVNGAGGSIGGQWKITNATIPDVWLQNTSGATSAYRNILIRQNSDDTFKFLSTSDAGVLSKDNILTGSNANGAIGIGVTPAAGASSLTVAGVIKTNDTTASTTTSTGALVVGNGTSGGLGVGGAINAGNNIVATIASAPNGSEFTGLQTKIGADGSLGPCLVHVGALPSATGGSRYGYVTCYDTGDWRKLYLGGSPGVGPSGGQVLIPATLSSTSTSSGALVVSGGVGVAGAVNVGTFYGLVDGVTAPGTESGYARIYVDSADGDLKVKFGDGTVKTIATDT